MKRPARKDAPQPAPSALRCAAPGVILAALAVLSFHDKAFTIDDTLFLSQAQHVLTDPLHPTAFEMTWMEKPERLSTIMPSGPVMAYLLVPTVLAGGSELLAHLVQLTMFALAILATVSLALRLRQSPWSATAAGLIVASTPAALSMATTSMPDVPAMTLGVVGIERLYAWKQEGRWPQALAAAVALALATLSRSHLLLLIGVGALALLARGEPWRWSAWAEVPRVRWAPLALAPALIWAIARVTADPLAGGGTLLSAAQSLTNWGTAARNAVALASHWALAMSLVLPWIAVRRGKLPWWVLLLAVPLVWAGLRPEALRHPGWLPLAAGLAVLVLVDAVMDAVRRRDAAQLFLAAWLFAPLPVVPYTHMAAKYLIASAPAAALLAARALAREPQSRSRIIAGATVALGLVLGILIIRADAALADSGRRAARELIAPRVARGEQVWFAGHWGYQWYAQKAGARCLTTTPPYPRTGDVVVSSRATLGGVIGHFPNRRLIQSMSESTTGGRVMSKREGAGFYSNAWGFLPWAWGSSEIDRFEVWQML